MNLSDQQIERYSRTIALPEIGVEGQLQLCRGRVLIIGAGGLGSPAALYLAAAGIGRLGLVDFDRVALDNLQRQLLHRTADIGRPKIESALETLRDLNPDVRVETFRMRFSQDNAAELLEKYDFVIDATDNFESKFLIADTCHFVSRPYSHAGVLGCTGQTMTVVPGRTACYRCIFHAPPPLDPAAPRPGILNAVPGIVGTIQAIEAMKYLLGAGRLLTDTLLVFDALETTFRRVAARRNPDCPLCGIAPSITAP